MTKNKPLFHKGFPPQMWPKPLWNNGLFFVYSFTNLIATAFEFLRKPKHILSILMLPFTFFILHISYGIGFLCGSFYFINKWGDIHVKSPSFNREIFSQINTKSDGNKN